MNAEIKTNVIKRNGEEVAFDLEKIINAIKGANKDVDYGSGGQRCKEN